MMRKITNTILCYGIAVILTDFERIGDHALNISKELVNVSMNER